MKNGLLEPVLRAFVANGSRYNLLNSAALELLDFIRKASPAQRADQITTQAASPQNWLAHHGARLTHLPLLLLCRRI